MIDMSDDAEIPNDFRVFHGTFPTCGPSHSQEMALSTDINSEPTFLAYLFGTGADYMVKKTLIKQNFVGLLAIGYLVVGCSTTETATDAAAVKTHYTLTTGATEIHPGMLPRETPVFVEWHYSNGNKTKNRGFTGWDFDGDGRFEMVDVHGDDAAVQTSVFDFDGDGTIDRKVGAVEPKNEGKAPTLP